MSSWLAFLTWLGVAKQEPKPKPVWFYTVHPLDTDPVLWVPTITDAKVTEKISLNVKRTQAEAEKAAKKAILSRGGTPRRYVAPGG